MKEKEKSKFIDEMLGGVEINLDEFHRSVYSIINKLKSIERTSYKITAYTESIIAVLKNSAEEYNSIYSRLFIAEDELELHFFADEQTILRYSKKLHDIQIDAIQSNITLTEAIGKIFTDNKPIIDFIIHRGK